MTSADSLEPRASQGRRAGGRIPTSDRRSIRRHDLRLLVGSAGREPRGGEIADDRDGGWRADVGEAPRGAIRVLLVATRALVRAAYRSLLESERAIEVVGEAATGEEAIAVATETRPVVVLLDESVPGLEGPEAIAALVSSLTFAGAAVMLVGHPGGDERVFGALRAGALGVLRVDDPPAALIRSVRLLARGHALLPAAAVRRLLMEFGSQRLGDGLASKQIDELTDREREVVALAARGLTNREIAARLVISPATAKTHISRAMIKLQARHRAQLVVSAYENGLVTPQRAVHLAA
jgi:DNA-binding NarL/FixJ family response regulator